MKNCVNVSNISAFIQYKKWKALKKKKSGYDLNLKNVNVYNISHACNPAFYPIKKWKALKKWQYYKRIKHAHYSFLYAIYWLLCGENMSNNGIIIKNILYK